MKNQLGKRVGIMFCILASAVFFTCAAMAAETETPLTLKNGKIISAEEAKKLFDQNAAVFVDVRKPLNYGKGHIKGAVLVEYKGKSENRENFDESNDQFAVDKLPADKNAKIVIYGHGTTGWRAYKGAVYALKAGYKNVLWYRAGFEDWERRGFPKE